MTQNSEDSRRGRRKRNQPKVVYQKKSQASTGSPADNVNVINVNLRDAANSAASSAAKFRTFRNSHNSPSAYERSKVTTPARDLLLAKGTVDVKLALSLAKAQRSLQAARAASNERPSELTAELTALPLQDSKDNPEYRIVILEQFEQPKSNASRAPGVQLPGSNLTVAASPDQFQASEVLELQ